MKPAIRLALVGAPVIVVLSLVFGAGGGDDLPSDTGQPTSADASQQAAESAADVRADEDAEIAKLPAGLADPAAKEIASELVSSADSSTLDWRSRYGAIEDTGDGSGYTAGIVGFCSGTSDMLDLVQRYTADHPDNPLAPYLPALREVNGTASHEGLDPGFTDAWRQAAQEEAFRTAQEETRDRLYFEPAVRQAKLDGLGPLGQYIYYDAMVLHGPDTDAAGFYGIRKAALAEADTVTEGGDEEEYLDIFLDAGRKAILAKPTERDTTRIDTMQEAFLDAGNFGLTTPLEWRVYGKTFRIPAA
ncbi:chitosanase [Streptomyces sp. NBC_01218]|uniref:chitosanase n=1 Tax=unclassified Streptomyces TaxID=2593676 RepID=UPI0023B9966D|nr:MULTISPECIES: chitosanase [unclassified Streptomyces]WEH38585.1 chitosanase [Streptomyces sp. AM 2-1-1]WSQ50243.1 chitosanase [Streptomyces sp. NBC_01218]